MTPPQGKNFTPLTLIKHSSFFSDMIRRILDAEVGFVPLGSRVFLQRNKGAMT